MPGKARRYSYSDQKKQKHRVRWVVFIVLILFLLYSALTSFAFSMKVLENDTMSPNLLAGDRFIFSNYNIYSFIPGLDSERRNLPLRRGNIVLVDMFQGERPGTLLRVFDGLVRFFTFQRASIIGQNEFLFIKRIIGLPGDEIVMNNFLVRVRVKGSEFSLTEFEVTEADYTPIIPHHSALWDSSLPFSGDMDKIVLGENEVFLLSDDRSNTNDSRTWGPVPLTNIQGRALFRYWPLNRLGRP